MSLLEVMIAASLGVIVTVTVVSFGVYVARLSKSTTSQLKFFHYARKSIEQVAKIIRYSKQIEVKESGKRVECIDETDTTAALYFADDDGNPLTLRNNKIYWVRDVTSGETPKVLARYVAAVPGKPIFAYIDRTSAVEVNFRIGDPDNIPYAVYHRETGPGPQGLTISTAIGPRNSYLDD